MRSREHLRPKTQNDLMEKLTENFPRRARQETFFLLTEFAHGSPARGLSNEMPTSACYAEETR